MGVEQKGAMLIASDTSGQECLPPRLAADRAYEFAYVATTNAIRGSVAGTALRLLALR